MTTQTSTAAAAPAQTPASPVAEFIRPAQLAGQINSQPLTTADEAAATALEMALRERAAGLHSSTPLVRRIATAITRALGLDEPAHALVELCAQVRDVGMIGLPDDLVLATGRLSTQDWQLLSAHPARSAQLLEAVHAPIAAVAIVRHHHERWDGQGYPDGLRGTDIPMLSRVIAVADGFVAIARDRPHRRGSGTDAALEQVSRESGSQFDPAILDALTHVVTGSSDPGRTSTAHRDTAATPPAARPEAPKGRPDVGRAIVALQSLPAFPLAHERVIAATRAATPITGDLITAVEADLAIMIAVLSAAAAESKRPVNGVEDAVAVLGPRGVRQAAATVNLAAFPWRTHREALLHQVHAHGLLVSRAARRIARLTSRHDEDTFNTLGLLHDIGKIALAQAGMDYADTLHPRTGAPEERAQRERRDTQFDHASIGGLAVKRAGLPQEFADAIHGHHQPGFKNERATLLRLADMIVHYSQGNPVNRTTLLELASACGLSAEGLQEVLLDLPHGGGSQRRRAEPSPLTDRETDVLRLLADGLVYAQIGLELKLAVSTVRSHLHKIYPKLDAVDRAQAVLRASEMGWI